MDTTNTTTNYYHYYYSILRTVLCKLTQFFYGFLFGKFMWYILVQPYAKFYQFFAQSTSYLPELIFSLAIALVFVSFLSARAVMVLFLPSIIGNATQNYIIMLLFISLFFNPLANVALNAVETGRVIGCSLSMTYEQLKERAKLILNPVIEILNNGDTDLMAIEQDLVRVREVVGELRQEAVFSRKQSEMTDLSMLSYFPAPTDTGDLKEVIEKKLGVDANTTQDLVNRTQKLLDTTSLDLDTDNLAFKLSVNVSEWRRLRNNTAKVYNYSPDEFNLTEIMYENCLGIFGRAKNECVDSVEQLRQRCRDNIGSFLATIFCSPVLYSVGSICPWVVNQLLDEVSLCNQIRNYSVSIDVDPFNITNGADVMTLYKNLTRQLKDLDDDILNTQKVGTIKRIEFNIGLNSQTRNLFFKTASLVKFIREKYSMRQAFYDLLLLLYEIYTSVTFVYIMIQACQYRNKYLTQIRFDNHYVTGLFVAIDKKRRLLKKSSILPLTGEEAEKYITTFTCRRRTQEERETQKTSCIVLIVFLLFTLSLFYLDNLFYYLLNSIEEHALIQFKELGHHQLNVKVKGEGAVARLVRSLTGQLSSIYDLNRITSTRECLPRSQSTSDGFYLEFALLVAAYTLIDQVSIYAMRLRRITAAFFYPDKEKQRIIFLYKLILMQRQNLARTGIDQLVNETNGNILTSQDEEFYTVRDAIRYISTCISQSLCCHRHNNYGRR